MLFPLLYYINEWDVITPCVISFDYFVRKFCSEHVCVFVFYRKITRLSYFCDRYDTQQSWKASPTACPRAQWDLHWGVPVLQVYVPAHHSVTLWNQLHPSNISSTTCPPSLHASPPSPLTCGFLFATGWSINPSNLILPSRFIGLHTMKSPSMTGRGRSRRAQGLAFALELDLKPGELPKGSYNTS